MKLYKNNRVDQAYEATPEELAERFRASEWFDVDWLFYRKLMAWLLHDENAVLDEEAYVDFEEVMHRAVYPEQYRK